MSSCLSFFRLANPSVKQGLVTLSNVFFLSFENDRRGKTAVAPSVRRRCRDWPMPMARDRRRLTVGNRGVRRPPRRNGKT